MKAHVIKYYTGLQSRKILWCGKKPKPLVWEFMNANHVAISVGGRTAPCKNCIKAIIRELKKEL